MSMTFNPDTDHWGFNPAAPLIGVCVALVWLGAAAITRYSSAGGLAAAAAMTAEQRVARAKKASAAAVVARKAKAEKRRAKP